VEVGQLVLLTVLSVLLPVGEHVSPHAMLTASAMVSHMSMDQTLVKVQLSVG